MAVYHGPVTKRSRRLGFSILETGKEFAKGKQRTTIPGQHGSARQGKKSDYGIHLAEKQKVRFMYGIAEKQFRLTFEKSLKKEGIAGTNFLQTLESRLDNLVYRAGLAKTRRQARQLVAHNHFKFDDGHKANIPSMSIKVGSKISLKDKSKEVKEIKEALDKGVTAEWIDLDKKNLVFTYKRLPNRDELNKEINEGLIVEFYNK